MLDKNEKKRWLREYGRMGIELKRLEDDREDTFAKMENLGAQVIDGMPKATGHRGGIAELMDEYIKLDDKMIRRQMEIVRRKSEIYDAINTLESPNQRVVIGYKYLDGLEWTEIAGKMGYCKKHVQNIHALAIENIKIESCE